MHQLAWVRLMVARHPSIYWLTIAVIAAVVAFSAARAVRAVDATRRSWGRQHTVWMAAASIEPGEPILADAHQVPLAVVPDDAVDADPAGTVARQRVGRGEIITDADLAAHGTTSLVPAGWVAFAMQPAVGRFAIGDHLSVYAGGQLACAGLVVDDNESALMIAVPADTASVIATALLADAVTLALTPAP